jgi:hypothetical protein
MDTLSIKETIMEKMLSELNGIMDKWCENYSNNCSGGKMRSDRGSDIEIFVRNSINNIGKMFGINLIAKKGSEDKKELKINTQYKEIIKQHQVDIHIYLNDTFIAVIECKAYLDSCYYVRACDDFTLFKKFNYSVKNYIFTLENSIDEDTKIFTDHITENICDDIFYILDGKRSSSNPIYDIKNRKQINEIKFNRFIEFVYMLGNIQ